MNHNKFFLEEVVDYTFRKYDDFRKLSIIFPNRRAGLYFQKALSKKIIKHYGHQVYLHWRTLFKSTVTLKSQMILQIL